MESVEDIAADAIMEGLPWSWTSYGEYLDAVPALRPALNVVGLAGHSPIRYEAMGEALSTLQPEYVNDFPLGGGRFIVKSRGYDATIVGGDVVVTGTELSDRRPGQVIREFDRS